MHPWFSHLVFDPFSHRQHISFETSVHFEFKMTFDAAFVLSLENTAPLFHMAKQIGAKLIVLPLYPVYCF